MSYSKKHIHCAKGPHAPHPDGRPNAGKARPFRSLRAARSFCRFLDGERVDLWHPGKLKHISVIIFLLRVRLASIHAIVERFDCLNSALFLH